MVDRAALTNSVHILQVGHTKKVYKKLVKRERESWGEGTSTTQIHYIHTANYVNIDSSYFISYFNSVYHASGTSVSDTRNQYN